MASKELVIQRIAWLNLRSGRIDIAKRNGDVIETLNSWDYEGRYVRCSPWTHLGHYLRWVVS